MTVHFVGGRVVGRVFDRDVKPIAKRLLHTTRAPGPLSKHVYAAIFDVHWVSRELGEWAWRSLVATPVFLARCATFGERVSVDRIPYVNGACRIELGHDVRISGGIGILGTHSGQPVLRIGNGVYIGHGASIAVARSVDIGDYCSIGGDTYIADTDGHSHTRLGVPIWEDAPGVTSAAPIVIEHDVHIARSCTILKGVRIGAGALIGAGSVVRGDVAPGAVVMGNPARVVGWRRTQAAGSEAAMVHVEARDTAAGPRQEAVAPHSAASAT